MIPPVQLRVLLQKLLKVKSTLGKGNTHNFSYREMKADQLFAQFQLS